MESPIPFRTASWRLAALFLAAFGFALISLNPTFYVDDSPETVTACVTLGIPHPPGYPLYTLLGRLPAVLPLGRLPFRVNLLSALLASAVCVLLFRLLKDRLGVSGRLAAVFSLLWMAGATTYPAALSAKTGIYELTALFLLAILGSLFSGRPALAAFLLGLSFANHWMTMAAFLPGLAVLFHHCWKEEGKGGRPWALWAGLFTLGLTPYLFLPLRAALGPALNWGEPLTWHRFVFDFLRSQYGGAEGTGGLGIRLQQAWGCLRISFLEFPGLLVLALWGAARVRRIRPRWVLAMGLMWLGVVSALSAYLNLRKEEFYLLKDYTLPIHVFLLVFGAWGLESFLASRPEASRRSWSRFALGLAVLFLAASAILRFDRQRQTDYTYSYDYVLNGFKALPKRALYFCKGDAVVFPSWYFQWVEGRRKDVAVVGVDGLPMEWVRQGLAKHHADFHSPFSPKPLGVESVPTLMDWIAVHNPDREIYFSYNQSGEEAGSGAGEAPYGLVERDFRPGEKFAFDEARARALWDGMRLRHLKEPGFPVDGRTNHWLVRDYAIFRNSLGIIYEDRADDAKANLGPRATAPGLLAVENDYEQSREDFAWAEEWDPTDEKFAFNLGNSLFHLGRSDEAMRWYAKAAELDPGYTSDYFNWAVVALQSGRFDKARELFRKVLELDPGNAQAKQGLDYLSQKGY